MKKAIILILVIIAIFALYFYKRAYSRVTLAVPQTDTGEVSDYNVPTVVKGAPTPKGTENLNLTGPVYEINDLLEQKKDTGTGEVSDYNAKDTESLNLSGAVSDINQSPEQKK